MQMTLGNMQIQIDQSSRFIPSTTLNAEKKWPKIQGWIPRADQWCYTYNIIGWTNILLIRSFRGIRPTRVPSATLKNNQYYIRPTSNRCCFMLFVVSVRFDACNWYGFRISFQINWHTTSICGSINSGNIVHAKTLNAGIILTKDSGLDSAGDPVGDIISGPSVILYV